MFLLASYIQEYIATYQYKTSSDMEEASVSPR